MALTRKFLSALGIEQEKIDEIITAHTETVDALKEQRDEYKDKAESVPTLTKEVEELKEQAKADKTDEWQEKYNTLKSEFDEYKKTQKAEEVKRQKMEAVKKVLEEIGIADKTVDSIVNVTDFDEIELENDQIKDLETFKETMAKKWEGFIVKAKQEGANIPNPPAKTGGGAFKEMSVGEKMRFANENPNAPEVIDWLKKE